MCRWSWPWFVNFFSSSLLHLIIFVRASYFYFTSASSQSQRHDRIGWRGTTSSRRELQTCNASTSPTREDTNTECRGARIEQNETTKTYLQTEGCQRSEKSKSQTRQYLQRRWRTRAEDVRPWVACCSQRAWAPVRAYRIWTHHLLNIEIVLYVITFSAMRPSCIILILKKVNTKASPLDSGERCFADTLTKLLCANFVKLLLRGHKFNLLWHSLCQIGRSHPLWEGGGWVFARCAVCGVMKSGANMPVALHMLHVETHLFLLSKCITLWKVHPL